MEEEFLSFKCKDCGSTELYVEHEYVVTEEIVNTLKCTCDDEHEFAAQRIHHIMTPYLDTMTLEDDHHMGSVENHEELDKDEEEIDYKVQCPTCLGETEQQDWSTEVESLGSDNHEFYVRCAGCDREIEFGWSHPGRGGRIWPAESSDFNPWKSWPEPRYRGKWLERGWIRPDLQQLKNG